MWGFSKGTGEPSKDIKRGDGIVRFLFRRIIPCGEGLGGREIGGMKDGEEAIG